MQIGGMDVTDGIHGISGRPGRVFSGILRKLPQIRIVGSSFSPCGYSPGREHIPSHPSQRLGHQAIDRDFVLAVFEGFRKNSCPSRRRLAPAQKTLPSFMQPVEG